MNHQFNIYYIYYENNLKEVKSNSVKLYKLC